MPKVWQDSAWEDYLYWQAQDKKTLMLQDIERNGYHGLGKPEPLKYQKQGWWSCRIDGANRLVFRIEGEFIHIAECRNHYEKH